MMLFVSCFRSAKANAKTAISARAVQMQTTPIRQLLTPESSPISSPCWTLGIAQTGTCLRSVSTESLSANNRAMDEIASKVAVERKAPDITARLLRRSTPEQWQYYIQKANDNCMVVCDGIAPNDGKQLSEFMWFTDLEMPDPIAEDLVRTLTERK